MCRHRALLFHILAKKAGLKSTLYAGEQKHEGEPADPFDHGWCEVKVGIPFQNPDDTPLNDSQ